MAKTVLIADSDEITRAGISSVLRGMGYNVVQAIDGTSAIKVAQEHTVDLALFDHAMSPMGGFDFARYVIGANLSFPLVLMVTERTSDLLNYANTLGITHYLSKPVDPIRLQAVLRRLLASEDNAPSFTALRFETDTTKHTPDEIMGHVFSLAKKNVLAGLGGPFAAVITSPDGRIYGEGTNLYSSRYDPVAHAEIMAIRQATERLQQPHLEGFLLYSVAEPTALAHALISSVGITDIYYGLTHQNVYELRKNILITGEDPPYNPAFPTRHQWGEREAQSLILSCRYDPRKRQYRIDQPS